MSWYPIAFLPPQLQNVSSDNYSGAVLKAYQAGTSTPIAIATDITGATTAASIPLNASGYPTYLGTIIIPHLQENYKLALYPDQASADANSGAVWTVDNIQIAGAVNNPFIQYFDGDGVNATFTLSEDLGNDESILMVFADRQIPNYITNGDFASDTIWSKGAGWSIGAGVATAAGAISTAISQNSNTPLVQGQSYTVEFTVTASAGTLTPSIGGNSGTTRGAGTWRETIIAGSTQSLAFTGVGFTGTLDNVSIKPTAAVLRMINRPDEYTLVGNQLTLNNIPPSGTKNVIVFAPAKLVGAANAAAEAAATSETNAANSATLAMQWATLTSGLVAATDYSSKAYAIGGTGIDTVIGSAKDWAIKTSAAVIVGSYSAKEYAQGTQASTGGSAKNWAQQTGADVTGASANSRSAKSWAQEDLTGATLGGSAKDWAQSSSLPDGVLKSAKSYALDALTTIQSLQGTSTTSVTIGTGSKAFTTQSGKYFNGQNVRVYSAAGPTNYMDGLASYSDTSLTVTVASIGGVGTFTDWVIKVNGDRGATGPAGSVNFGVPTEASPALNDEILINDVSEAGGTVNKITLQQTYNIINLLTTDSSPDAAADYVATYDASAGVAKKVLLALLGPPAGSVIAYGGSAAPTGYLMCYGQAVSRTTYSTLFTAISTSFGAGDGSTTFNVPDLRGRVVAGIDNMGGSAANRITSGGSGITGTTLGAAGGTETHTLTTAQLPSITPTGSFTGSALGTHTHFVCNTGVGNSSGIVTVSSGNYLQAGNGNVNNKHYGTGDATTANAGISSATSAGTPSGSISINSFGSGNAHQNTQPTIMMNAIIKT